MKQLLRLALKLYQYTFGLVLPPSCRFYPSCSEYAREALRVYPLYYAIWLIVKRLLKCQPLCRGGLDPLPLPTERRQRTVGKNRKNND